MIRFISGGRVGSSKTFLLEFRVFREHINNLFYSFFSTQLVTRIKYSIYFPLIYFLVTEIYTAVQNKKF